MVKHGDNTYGDDYASVYDHLFEDRDNLYQVGETLAALAGNGPVLEFGIGTGRLAVPLAERGIKVVGIDNSESMLKKLREKPEAKGITGVLGDCTQDRIEGDFSLVFVAFSTLYVFENQETQVRCFENAAWHLKPGGLFLVEAFVHDRSRWHFGQETTTTKIEHEFASVRVGLHDPLTQLIKLQYMDFTPQGIKFRPNRLRYVWPSEMDLMARIAGLRLKERWGGWDRSPFTSESNSQVAVYEKI
jgi:SAM-dependent methyltransferase